MRFLEAFKPDGQPSISEGKAWRLGAELEARSQGLRGFLTSFAGVSFNNGLYRVHSIAELPKWNNLIREAFPDFRKRIFCFSYDWLGRHFAVDTARQESGQNLVLMLEPGTGQTLEIPASFEQFHNDELVDFQSAALASDFYRTWMESGGKPVSPTECVGYRKPLFLGGADTLTNLEVKDMEVYWSICGQLLAKTRGLPDGARIDRIDIE